VRDTSSELIMGGMGCVYGRIMDGVELYSVYRSVLHGLDWIGVGYQRVADTLT
jgi:hypothetical protein